MPRKTLALISGLVLITFILFVIALKSTKTAPPPASMTPPLENQAISVPTATPLVPVHSVLSLSPNPVSVAPGQSGSVAVNIDTSDNEVTAVQLEIAYDPNVVSNVQVVPGALFTNPVVLINKNSVKEGRFTYAFGITPNHTPIQGNGTAATITFKVLNKPGEVSQMTLLPTTLVTARGISNSVLKSATGTLVQITNI